MPTQIGQNGPTTLPVIYGPAFFNADLGLFKNFDISEGEEAAVPVQRLQLPEPSAVVVPGRQPDSRVRRHHRGDQHAAVRLRDAESKAGA